MKVSLVVYRLISFILLPIAGLNAFGLIGLIPASLSNPPIILGVFIQFATIAYTITSFIFLTRGILAGQPQKPGLKDWIKVNAFVSVIFSALVIFCCLVYFSSPTMQKAIVKNLDNLPPSYVEQVGGKANFIKQITTMLAGAGVFSAILFIHILITFRLLKQHTQVFGANNNQPRREEDGL